MAGTSRLSRLVAKTDSSEAQMLKASIDRLVDLVKEQNKLATESIKEMRRNSKLLMESNQIVMESRRPI